jgi:hypothetical protein
MLIIQFFNLNSILCCVNSLPDFLLCAIIIYGKSRSVNCSLIQWSVLKLERAVFGALFICILCECPESWFSWYEGMRGLMGNENREFLFACKIWFNARQVACKLEKSSVITTLQENLGIEIFMMNWLSMI